MIIKAILVGVLATSGAVVTIHSKHAPQDPQGQDRQFEVRSDAEDLSRFRLEIERLQGEVAELAILTASGGEELEEAQRRADAAELRNRHLEEEIEYCQETHTRRNRDRRNCTPSRSMLVQFNKVINGSGNERLAKRIARDVAETVGDRNDSLNSYTWALLTKSKYKGRHNDLALMLAERMESRPRQLNHLMLDTIALAKFRGGYVDEAISLQKRALQKNKRSSEYKQRLRMYEEHKAACAAPAKKRIVEKRIN